jgi:hypothetical protein
MRVAYIQIRIKYGDCKYLIQKKNKMPKRRPVFDKDGVFWHNAYYGNEREVPQILIEAKALNCKTKYRISG